jgi:hypothetical protein
MRPPPRVRKPVQNNNPQGDDAHGQSGNRNHQDDDVFRTRPQRTHPQCGRDAPALRRARRRLSGRRRCHHPHHCAEWRARRGDHRRGRRHPSGTALLPRWRLRAGRLRHPPHAGLRSVTGEPAPRLSDRLPAGTREQLSGAGRGCRGRLPRPARPRLQQPADRTGRRLGRWRPDAGHHAGAQAAGTAAAGRRTLHLAVGRSGDDRQQPPEQG